MRRDIGCGVWVGVVVALVGRRLEFSGWGVGVGNGVVGGGGELGGGWR